MTTDLFQSLAATVAAGNPRAALELLGRELRAGRRYDQLLDARLLSKRHELGLPLIQVEPFGALPDETRRAYEDAYLEACREVGGLYLAEGDIPHAWPYFRAIGEYAPVAEAIDRLAPETATPEIVDIAYSERANPTKGFEFILANYGTCSAITSFEQYPVREGREHCIGLLVKRLHGELVASLRHDIARREGTEPVGHSVAELIAGRTWLFEDNNYHVDTSHLSAVVRFSIDLKDPAAMRLALELTEYGRHLVSMFQYRGQPPFEDPYRDYAAYLRTLLGEAVEAGIAHFRQKVQDAGPEAATIPAQVLVVLLTRIGRYDEAIAVSLEYLREPDGPLLCLAVSQLCQLAERHAQLQEIAREWGDLVNYTAALLQSK